jgi:hypothetical protein
MARRTQPQAHQPQYEWAMSTSQQPVHITQAVRGETYVCPVCGGRMIAKLGDVKRHHFAHESIQICTPERVTRIVARYWLVAELQTCLDVRRSLVVTWPCPLCQQDHSADLLHDISALESNYEHAGLRSDIALLDEQRAVRAVILLDTPSNDALIAYSRQQITVIVVDMSQSRKRLHDLATLLAGARFYGGRCSTQEIATESGIITEPDRLHDLLIEAVAVPPYHLYGPLDQHKGLTHVFLLGSNRLWLPPILWQRAIGGLHHAINPALQIISQEWPQDDGSIIALYYITARDSYAIAVRRFPPGQQAYARLDNAVFRTSRLNAVNIARSFAEL